MSRPKLAVTVRAVWFDFGLHDGFDGASTVPFTVRVMSAFCVPSTEDDTVAVPEKVPATDVLTGSDTVVDEGASAAVIDCEPLRMPDPLTVAASASTPSGVTTLAAFETWTDTVIPVAPRMTGPKVLGAVACITGGIW